jgi:hypothetical protein
MSTLEIIFLSFVDKLVKRLIAALDGFLQSHLCYSVPFCDCIMYDGLVKTEISMDK